MNYSVCVCDLDGTLLNSQKRISERDLSALHALIESGVYVTIATGRSPLQIREYVAQIGVNAPLICCNGGIVCAPNGGHVLDMSCIDPTRVTDIMGFCDARGLDYLMYAPDFIYHCPHSVRIEGYRRYNARCDSQFCVPIRSTSEFSGDPITKILVLGDEARLSQISLLLSADSSLEIVSSGLGLIDIMSHGVTKGRGLSVLADSLKIHRDEIVCFGDSPNDVSMFSCAGFPIAMANACDDILARASFVTLDNDSGGVAHGIAHAFGIRDYSA